MDTAEFIIDFRVRVKITSVTNFRTISINLNFEEHIGQIDFSLAGSGAKLLELMPIRNDAPVCW